jgi:hypothetical protein
MSVASDLTVHSSPRLGAPDEFQSGREHLAMNTCKPIVELLGSLVVCPLLITGTASVEQLNVEREALAR